jgi:flap endonuclease-1
MVEEAKTLLTLLGIPWIQAPSEGEAQAAFLTREGRAWATGSKDYDSLLFGTPRLVRFLAVSSSEFLPSVGRSRLVPPELLDLDENLRLLGLTREQLVDVSILVGTDFNAGVKGIGPKTAVRRIREWGALKHAPTAVQDALPANVEAIQSFFLNPPVTIESVPPAAPPNEPGLYQFLCEERGFARSRVENVIARLHRASGRQTTLDI